MGGGGKGGGAPSVAPTYADPNNGKSYASQPELDQEILDRQTAELRASIDSNQRTTDTNTANQAKFLSDAAAAKTRATGSINDYFTQHGVDPSQYSQQIADQINTESGHLINPGAYAGGSGNNNPTSSTVNGVTTTSPTTPVSLINYGSIDPSSVYTATDGSDLFTKLQGGAQSKALQGYNSLFSPSYSQGAVGDAQLQPAIDSVLKSQFDPLNAQLMNAKNRGSLNDVGYQAALTALGNDRTKAQSTVSSLGQGILAKDRGDIDSYIGTGRTAAGSVPLGTSFDSSPYVTGASGMAARQNASFGGDLTNAVGKTSFSDLTSLLNAGGNVQGATDPSATNPLGGPGGGNLSPEAIAQQAIAKQPRGLGTEGAF